jgi:hypothetical protein
MKRVAIALNPTTSLFEASLDGVSVGDSFTREGAVARVYQALATLATDLAALLPADAPHYQRAAEHLRAGPVNIAMSGARLYFISRAGGSEHTVQLNGNPAHLGIRRHTCTCANPQVCWARALAEVLEAWREQAEQAEQAHEEEEAAV